MPHKSEFGGCDETQAANHQSVLIYLITPCNRSGFVFQRHLSLASSPSFVDPIASNALIDNKASDDLESRWLKGNLWTITGICGTASVHSPCRRTNSRTVHKRRLPQTTQKRSSQSSELLAAVENTTNQLGYVGIIMDKHGSSVQCLLG